jgi:acyl-CoA reductase-like NAD-dependent aldehyde dehydrogenase
MIESNKDELALLESLDVGKPITDSLTFDIPAAAAIVRFNAESVDKIYGNVYAADKSALSFELRRPLGVIAAIVGWNFPLVLGAMKAAPVLATGNSLILKPSEVTSLTAARMAEMAIEAGVPPGVFNVIHGGAAIGEALASHQEIDGITFTGSTQTGKHLMVVSGQSNMKRLVLECGGKAPNIVFSDCPDLETVAEAVVARAFWNQGEVCTASSRLLIHESIKDEFLAYLIGKVSTLTPGDPLDPSTRYGAIVSQAHQKKILGYIESGKRDGARIAYQADSSAPYENGFYVSPVIFTEVLATHRIAREEIFGPVLSVITFRNEAEAIRIANATIYGLSAIVWTRDLGRAHRMSHGIKAGSVVVNATAKPAGGPGAGALMVGGHKQSGLGAEGGLEALRQYMSSTAVQYFV